MDRKSDELILQGLRQGDCKAFDELYMRYAPVSYTHLDVYKRQEQRREEVLKPV